MTDKERAIQYVKVIQASAAKLIDFLENAEDHVAQEVVSNLSPFNAESAAEPVRDEPAPPVKFEPDWDEWPEAVPQFLISETTPSGILKRARSVLNMCDFTDLSGKRFLDYGCGDGSMVREAKERGAAEAHGYDVVEEWAPLRNMDGLYFTSSFEKLNSAYDAILLYDVLDHCVTLNPLQILEQVRSIIDKDGQVKVRCHPFTSKHANHVYRTFNKAYSHLFLTPEQLSEHEPLPVLKMTGVNPLEEYKRWFQATGFEVVKENVLESPVDRACVKNVPRQELKSIVNHENYLKILEIQFVDYTLIPR